jgi:beta-glucosidase-like glycosyl hydrolase
MPVVTHTWQEIFQRDLVPFMDLMFHRPGERLRSVMVSHAAFPDISEFLQDLFRQQGDPPTLQGLHEFPATISGNVTTRLLRRVLKFDGLVITDDMEMGAVVQTLSVPAACLRAIEAGSDMVLICEHEANVIAARDELVRAVREQRLSMRALNASVRRMDWAMKLAGGPEQFDAEEFKAVSRRVGELNLDLKAAEETGQYAPVYGTDEGGTRLSSNFYEPSDPRPEGGTEE